MFAVCNPRPTTNNLRSSGHRASNALAICVAQSWPIVFISGSVPPRIVVAVKWDKGSKSDLGSPSFSLWPLARGIIIWSGVALSKVTWTLYLKRSGIISRKVHQTLSRHSMNKYILTQCAKRPFWDIVKRSLSAKVTQTVSVNIPLTSPDTVRVRAGYMSVVIFCLELPVFATAVMTTRFYRFAQKVLLFHQNIF